MSGNSKNAGFTVYCEDENMSGMSSLPPSTGEWQVPPTKPITTKENTQKAGKWTESKVIKQRHVLFISFHLAAINHDEFKHPIVMV